MTWRAIFDFSWPSGGFSHTGIVAGGFLTFGRFFPNWRRSAMTLAVVL
jgi:hypothetical protein